MWCIQCCADGFDINTKGQFQIGLQLCSLPVNINKIRVKWSVYIKELIDISYPIDTFKSNYDYYNQQIYGCNVISFNKFRDYNGNNLTVCCNIELYKLYHINGNKIELTRYINDYNDITTNVSPRANNLSPVKPITPSKKSTKKTKYGPYFEQILSYSRSPTAENSNCNKIDICSADTQLTARRDTGDDKQNMLMDDNDDDIYNDNDIQQDNDIKQDYNPSKTIQITVANDIQQDNNHSATVATVDILATNDIKQDNYPLKTIQTVDNAVVNDLKQDNNHSKTVPNVDIPVTNDVKQDNDDKEDETDYSRRLTLPCVKMLMINTPDKYIFWTWIEVVEWIVSIQQDVYKRYRFDLSKIMKKNKINGYKLVQLTQNDVKSWKNIPLGIQINIFKAIQKLKAKTINYTSWNSSDIARFILQIDDLNDIQKYKHSLRDNIKKQAIDGSLFASLQRNDYHKFGITNNIDVDKIYDAYKKIVDNYNGVDDKLQKINVTPWQADEETHDVDNVLVVCVIIGEYSDNKKYPPLNNIEDDINLYYKPILGDKYNYKLMTSIEHNNNNSRKLSSLYMTTDELTSFLRKCKNELIDTSNHDKYIVKYSGLILTIGGHGVTDALLCSDGKKYKYHDIRNIFNKYKELCQIPKMYLIDACRDINIDDIKDNNNNNDRRRSVSGSSSCVTYSISILGTSEGHSVRGCMVAKYLCEQFKICQKNQKYITFGKMHKLAKKKLENNTDQTFIMNEVDSDMFDVVYKPYIHKKDN